MSGYWCKGDKSSIYLVEVGYWCKGDKSSIYLVEVKRTTC